jgi:hypothetical protein
MEDDHAGFLPGRAETMSKPEKRKGSSRKARKATEAPETEAAFATLGREFVRLIRSERSREAVEQAAALKLAEWLYEHRLTKAERRNFMTRTGWVFDCALSADDPLRHTRDDEPPSAELTDPEVPF